MMEGPQSVVCCTVVAPKVEGTKTCEYRGKCEVQGVMNDLNSRVIGFLAGIRLTDLAEFKSIETKAAAYEVTHLS